MTEIGPETVVWTFGYDVSGIASATLKIRVDSDGRNDLNTDANDTFAGGVGVGAWRSITMQRRQMPTGNPFNDPEINTSILPDEIAEVLWTSFDDVSGALVDYYVEARDNKGNVARTAIQHVYIGDAAGQGTTSIWSPSKPCATDPITVCAQKAGFLHWGIDGWSLPPQELWPAGSTAFGDGKSVESPLVEQDDGKFCVIFGPVGKSVDTVDFVWHWADGSWDNNGGGDYHIDIYENCSEITDDLGPTDNASGSDVGGYDAGGGEDVAVPDVAEDVNWNDAISGDVGPVNDVSGAEVGQDGYDGDVSYVPDAWRQDSCCRDETLLGQDSATGYDSGNSYDLPNMPQIDENYGGEIQQGGDILGQDNSESSDGCSADPAAPARGNGPPWALFGFLMVVVIFRRSVVRRG